MMYRDKIDLDTAKALEEVGEIIILVTGVSPSSRRRGYSMERKPKNSPIKN
jgi:hypothetical protein